MKSIIDRFSTLVKGTVFGFDRIVLKGHTKQVYGHFRLSHWCQLSIKFWCFNGK
jgi:hypothetical protein